MQSKKRVYIHNDPESGAQWLGDGCGIYLLEGMPRLTSTDEVLRLFDVPESKRDDYYCKYEDLPSGIDFSDGLGIDGDGVKDLTATIGWLGESYRLFQDGRELYAINEAYLAPFAGDLSYIKYHRRDMKGGGFLLGVNVGLGLQAVIYPAFLHRQDIFTEGIQEIAEAFLFMQRNYPTPAGAEETPEDGQEQQTL